MMRKLVIIGLSLLVMSCASLQGSGSNSPKKRNYVEVEDLNNLDKINYQLGVDYIRNNNFSIAETKLMNVVKSEPNFPDAYNALGVLQERRGKISDAITLFAKAIALNPYYGTAVNNYSRLQCRANGPSALASTAQGTNGAVSAGMYSGAAECAIAKESYSEALGYADNAIQADTRYALGHYYRALALANLSRYQDTLSSLAEYHDIEGYTDQGVSLGLEVATKLNNQAEIDKFNHVLKTQF